MKKFSFFILTLLYFYQSVFAHPCGPFDVYLPCFQSQFKFSLSALFIKSNLAHLDFAQSVDFQDPTVTEAHNIGTNYDYGGYEIGLGYDVCGTANDIRFDYIHNMQTHSETKLSGSNLTSRQLEVDLPLTQFSDTLTIFALGIPIGTTTATGSLLNIAIPDSIAAHANFDQDVIDLEGGQSLFVTPKLRFRIMMGIRGSKLVNEFGQTLLKRSVNPDTVRLTSPLVLEDVTFINRLANFKEELTEISRFSGVGPRIGLEGNYYVAVGVSFFASISGATLIGEIDSNTRQTSNFHFNGEVAAITTTPLVPDLIFVPSLTVGELVAIDSVQSQHFTAPSNVRIVPNAEAKLGLSYCQRIPCCRSRFILEAGYVVNHYWNSCDWISPVVIDNNLMTDVQDVGYDGVYLAFKMLI